MYWIEPEGYQQWLFFNHVSKKRLGYFVLTSVGVLCATIIILVFRDYIGHQVVGILFLILVFPAILAAIAITRIAQLYFNIDVESTEIRLDSFEIFSGENGEGRSSEIMIDEISSFKFEFVEWKEYKFCSLIVINKTDDIFMFGMREFDRTRLQTKIERILTRGRLTPTRP